MFDYQTTSEIIRLLQKTSPQISWEIIPTGGGCSYIQGLTEIDSAKIELSIVDAEDFSLPPTEWTAPVLLGFNPEYGHGYNIEEIATFNNPAEMAANLHKELTEFNGWICSECCMTKTICKMNSTSAGELIATALEIINTAPTEQFNEYANAIQTLLLGYRSHVLPTCNDYAWNK